jgi:large subunit ribosomal protein L10
MKISTQNKINAVNELSSNLKDATSILIFEYHGVPTSIIAKTRKRLHDAKATIFVAKNNIFNRALKENNLYDKLGELSGPNAMIISHGDEILPFKEVFNLSTEYKLVTYKNGLINNDLIGQDKLKELSSIPSRDALFATLLGCLQFSIKKFLLDCVEISKAKN